MRTLSNGEPWIGLGAIRFWEGGDTLSDKSAVNGSDGVDGGGVAGEGETDYAKAVSLVPGGAGFTGSS